MKDIVKFLKEGKEDKFIKDAINRFLLDTAKECYEINHEDDDDTPEELEKLVNKWIKGAKSIKLEMTEYSKEKHNGYISDDDIEKFNIEIVDDDALVDEFKKVFKGDTGKDFVKNCDWTLMDCQTVKFVDNICYITGVTNSPGGEGTEWLKITANK